jgi:hypothetical protein
MTKTQIADFSQTVPWMRLDGSVYAQPADPKAWYAMVYVISNISIRHWYIGKKFLWTSVRRRGKKQLIPSDWQTYWSSSTELQDHLQADTVADHWRRTVLLETSNRSAAGYAEARLQFDAHAIEPINRTWSSWNGIINCRVSRKHIARSQIVPTCDPAVFGARLAALGLGRPRILTETADTIYNSGPYFRS